MKKTVLSALLAVFALTALCGCSANTAKVTLGTYKGIEIEKSAYYQELTEELIEEEINNTLQYFASSQEVDRPIEEGDTAVIDFVGKLDGVAFENGSATDQELVIGSNRFIAGFEEGLIGAKAGDFLELALTFPEDYHEASLAGQDVVFEVTVKSVKENVLPEFDDAFAKENLGVENAQEYRDFIKSYYEQSNVALKADAAWKVVKENCKIERYPQKEIDNYIAEAKAYYAQLAEEAEQDLQTYLSENYSISMEEYEEQLQELAYDEIGTELIVEQIARRENLDITEEEYGAYVQTLLEEWGYASNEEFAEDYGCSFEEYFTEEELKKDLLLTKVQQFVADHAVEI